MEIKKSVSDKPSFDALSDIEKTKYTEKVLKISEELMKDEKVVTKLTGYTFKRIQKYTKHHSINGKEAEDFIQDAILRTAEGDRPFTGITEKDLLDHLYYIIPSLILGELKKIKIKLEVRDESGIRPIYPDKFISIDEMIDNLTNDDDDDKPGFELASRDSSLLDQIIFQEELNEIENYIYSVIEKNDDIIALYLYESKINGVKNPHKHVAKQLNVSIEEVRNAEKRLKRIINKAKRLHNGG
jgi:RNA polymerase sigma factor (sigma-70 family)